MINRTAVSALLVIAWMVTGPHAAVRAGAAGVADSVDIADLVREALARSPSVLAKRAAYESARARAATAWLPEDPMIGIDVEGQDDLLDADSRTNYEYMVSQTVPFPTKLFLRGVMASREADAAYHAYKEEERAVAWQIEQPSHAWTLASRTARALEETEKLAEQMAEIVRSRYESNKAHQSDYLKIQIELERISIERFNWEQEARIAEASLSRQLNQPMGTSYRISSRADRPLLKMPLEELEALALKKRPELQFFKAGVEFAEASRTYAHTEWLPDLTGRIEAMQPRGASDVSRYDNFIGVTVPVWSLLKGAGGGWRAAQKEVETAEALYSQMKNETLFRVHEAYAKCRAAENALNTYESLILPQSKSQVDIALSAYEAGTADFLDLIDAERTYKDTQVGYYRALSDYETAFSDLCLAVGEDRAVLEARR